MDSQFEALLGDTVIFRRATIGQTSMGGPKETWADHQTAQCFVEPLSLRESFAADRKIFRATHRIYTLTTDTEGVSLDVTETDQAVIGNLTYGIVGVQAMGTDEEIHHLEILLELVR